MNAIQHFPGFVYQDIRLCRHHAGPPRQIKITVAAHGGMAAKCSRCLKPAPCYDRLEQRSWLFVPLWGMVTWFLYAARRVDCPEHGVVVEHLPWSEGKRPVTLAMIGFLSRWARRLSWQETAQAFGTSWECVYRSVEWFVQWGLAHRKLAGVESIGVDEIHWGQSKGANSFLTVIYQIDRHCRRLLWVGPKRTQTTLRRGLAALGPEVVGGLRFVCTDMWRPYLNVIAAQVGQALHVLDRFHITSHLNQAVDQVRRAESTRVRGRAKHKLCGLLHAKLGTGRAWMLKKTFQDFWHYRSLTWARAFLDVWTTRALRSRLEPMQKVARMLRSHEELILNWFKAKGEISSGAVEGLNNKIRVVTKRSYGFRTYDAMEIALYHTLGKLPEPNEFTHKFC